MLNVIVSSMAISSIIDSKIDLGNSSLNMSQNSQLSYCHKFSSSPLIFCFSFLSAIVARSRFLILPFAKIDIAESERSAGLCVNGESESDFFPTDFSASSFPFESLQLVQLVSAANACSSFLKKYRRLCNASETSRGRPVRGAKPPSRGAKPPQKGKA